ERLSRALHRAHHWLSQDSVAARTFPPLQPEMMLRQPDLAATLETIARSGFGGFYFGELGRAIAEAVQSRGGFITAADMTTYRTLPGCFGRRAGGEAGRPARRRHRLPLCRRRGGQPGLADPERRLRVRVRRRGRGDRDPAPEPRLLLQPRPGPRQPAGAAETD